MVFVFDVDGPDRIESLFAHALQDGRFDGPDHITIPIIEAHVIPFMN